MGDVPSDEATWLDVWEQRLSCWWIGLPTTAQTRLVSCAGALGHTFGSRLESMWRGGGGGAGAGGAGGGGGGGGSGHQMKKTSHPSKEPLALFNGASDPTCVDWIGEHLGQLHVPDFPSIPPDMSLENALGQFELPALPKLLPLPWGVQRWQELGHKQEMQSLQPEAPTAGGSAPWASAMAASAGGFTGALAALMGVRMFSARRHARGAAARVQHSPARAVFTH